jgi:hypothetical protein
MQAHFDIMKFYLHQLARDEQRACFLRSVFTGIVLSAFPPSLSCGASLCSHVRCCGRGSAGSRRGTCQGASLGFRQRTSVPSARASVQNFTPDLRSAHIAACAERQSRHSAPAGSSASRAD